jgi:ABC-2 type transport system ATP-binding protein
VVRTYKGARGAPPRRAVDGLSLSVGRGEWVALLGPNGSGKSTLVRILATLDRPDEGRVLAFGDDLAESGATSRYRRSLAVVFQHPGLDKLLTVRENLAAQAALHGLRGAGAADAIARVAGLLQIADRLGDRVGTLSGGLARRCDLARALLPRPMLLILDEATAGLDHDSRTGFMALIEALRKDPESAAMTVLMTTHLMDEAERAGRVVMMHAGRVVLNGTPAALRTALGGATVRCPAGSEHAERILRDAGLVTDVRAGERIARVGQEAGPTLAAVAAQLAAAGVPFQVSPPTLGDAYLVATGEALAGSREGGHAA